MHSSSSSTPWLACWLVALVTTTGCGASLTFYYGKPPIAPLSADSHTRCTFRKRIVIRRAAVDWEKVRHLGTSSTHNFFLVSGGRVKGLSFYQGTKLVSADSVLNVIQDPDLVVAYRKLYVKDKRSHRVAKTVGWISVSTAIASTVIGAGLVADQVYNNRANAQLYTGIGFLSLAVVGYLVGFVELGIAADYGNTVEAYEGMFLARSYESRMIKAVQEHNIKATSECSGSAPPE